MSEYKYADSAGLGKLAENIFTKIKSIFAPKNRGVEYIRGTWTAASGTWTGVTADSELYDGKQIILYMPFAGSGNATLNLTLSGGGTTGAKNVYFENTTRFTTHKGQNSQLPLIYHKAMQLSNGTTYEGWWYLANRDTTVNYQMRNANAVKAKNDIPQYHLAGGTDTGYVKIVSGAVFDVSYPLLVTQAAWKANMTYTNGFFEYQDQNIRNTITALGSSYAGLTAYKMIYLVGTLNGTSFTVDSSLVTCTQPTSDDGKAYIPLGLAYDTYRFYFYSQRNVYGFRNGKFQELSTHSESAGNSLKVNNHTVEKDVPSNAVFTDTTALASMTGTLAIDHGGTGATSAADARTNLGLGAAATYAVETAVANDAKLPTGAAVKSFVEGKGYTTNTGTITEIKMNGASKGSSGVIDLGTVATSDTNTRRAFYGTCDTAAATKDKVVTLSDTTGWELLPGTIVGVKFTNTNSYSSAAANPITLNVNGTGAKNIWYNTTHSGAGNTGTNTTIYGTANRYTWYMYDGTYWVWIHYGVVSNSNTVPAAQCETAAGTAAKAATCTNYTLTANTYLHFNIRYANTYIGDLTMNVNSKGAKPIYINGTASSVTNHTLPAGSYIAFYDGTNWQFRTDGKLPANIIGTVNGHTVNSDVPANVRFSGGSFFGTCTSGAAYADKVVTLANDSGWELLPGVIVGVQFTNTNTADHVTLNVNNSGAKYIHYDDAIYLGTDSTICGYANRINYYMYNGARWVFLNQSQNAKNDTNVVTSVNGKTGDVQIPVGNGACLVVNCGTISNLPSQINRTGVTSDMVCINSYFSEPSAQKSRWEIYTSEGSISINGEIEGSTSLILYLMKGEEVS